MSATVEKNELRADELAKLPPAEQLARVVEALNKVTADASGVLAGRISPQKHLGVLEKRIPVTSSSFPLTLEVGPKHADPLKVEVAGVEVKNSPDTVPTVSVGVYFRKGGEGKLRLLGMPGLSAATDYLVTLLIWPR